VVSLLHLHHQQLPPLLVELSDDLLDPLLIPFRLHTQPNRPDPPILEPEVMIVLAEGSYETGGVGMVATREEGVDVKAKGLKRS